VAAAFQDGAQYGAFLLQGMGLGQMEIEVDGGGVHETRWR
jgi:hypothetical protein